MEVSFLRYVKSLFPFRIFVIVLGGYFLTVGVHLVQSATGLYFLSVIGLLLLAMLDTATTKKGENLKERLVTSFSSNRVFSFLGILPLGLYLVILDKDRIQWLPLAILIPFLAFTIFYYILKLGRVVENRRVLTELRRIWRLLGMYLLFSIAIFLLFTLADLLEEMTSSIAFIIRPELMFISEVFGHLVGISVLIFAYLLAFSFVANTSESLFRFSFAESIRVFKSKIKPLCVIVIPVYLVFCSSTFWSSSGRELIAASSPIRDIIREDGPKSAEEELDLSDAGFKEATRKTQEMGDRLKLSKDHLISSRNALKSDQVYYIIRYVAIILYVLTPSFALLFAMWAFATRSRSN
jgi:hypothetical protein